MKETVGIWISYSFENKSSHPPKPGRYLIYRSSCDKIHFEKWNGNGYQRFIRII